MDSVNTLAENLTWMYGLERFGIKLGLEVMRQLLAALDNPETKFKSVHITGTNGKGSTAAFIERVLRESGLKTGLYTSPHLYVFNERIRINGMEINDEQLVELIQKVRSAAEENKVQPTFFEFTTAIAFLFLAQQKVDLAVIEVGMGGRLDATNVITPLVSVITNIGHDHIPILGKNRYEIAQDKSGIIKEGIDVVTAEQDPEMLEIFQKACAEKHARLWQVDAELIVKNIHSTFSNQLFEVSGVLNDEFRIKLLGAHQITNAATALLTLEKLKIDHGAMKRGLAATHWEGRLDIVSTKPFILVDGAHNPEGVSSLERFLSEKQTELPNKEVLVLAMKKGKDLNDLVTKIAPQFKQVIVTEGNYEPEAASAIAEQVREVNKNVLVFPKVPEAITEAKKLVTENGMILVTGSLYMIGDALKELRKP